jgi:hypothetical protein
MKNLGCKGQASTALNNTGLKIFLHYIPYVKPIYILCGILSSAGMI